MINRLVCLLFICMLKLTLVDLVNAAVLFSDDFEWGSDWDSSQGTAVPIANGWNGILMANRGGQFEASYVNSTNAHSGSRGWTQYWDSTATYGSAQENWFTTNSITFPGHYYVGYWFRIDPNWDWGGASSLKFLKTNFADVSNATWDIVWVASANFVLPTEYFVIDGQYWAGDSNCGRTLSTDDAVRSAYGCWNAINDGNWHYFVWDFNHDAGTLGLKIDGVDVFQMGFKTEPYGEPYESSVNGSERWNFGGNITDGGGAVAEMWTAYDDVIIATTEAEVLNFLGIAARHAAMNGSNQPLMLSTGWMELLQSQ